MVLVVHVVDAREVRGMAKRDNLVTARVDPADLPKVEAIMSAQDRSRSYVVKSLIKAGLAQCPGPGQLPPKPTPRKAR